MGILRLTASGLLRMTRFIGAGSSTRRKLEFEDRLCLVRSIKQPLPLGEVAMPSGIDGEGFIVLCPLFLHRVALSGSRCSPAPPEGKRVGGRGQSPSPTYARLVMQFYGAGSTPSRFVIGATPFHTDSCASLALYARDALPVMYSHIFFLDQLNELASTHRKVVDFHSALTHLEITLISVFLNCCNLVICKFSFHAKEIPGDKAFFIIGNPAVYKSNNDTCA